MHKIKRYKDYLGVSIYRDYNVVGEQVYIGNGQGCRTFWFKDVAQAKKFIAQYREQIKITVYGLIPKDICKKCKAHYSYNSPEWLKHKDFNCKEFKEELKRLIK